MILRVIFFLFFLGSIEPCYAQKECNIYNIVLDSLNKKLSKAIILRHKYDSIWQIDPINPNLDSLLVSDTISIHNKFLVYKDITAITKEDIIYWFGKVVGDKTVLEKIETNEFSNNELLDCPQLNVCSQYIDNDTFDRATFKFYEEGECGLFDSLVHIHLVSFYSIIYSSDRRTAWICIKAISGSFHNQRTLGFTLKRSDNNWVISNTGYLADY